MAYTSEQLELRDVTRSLLAKAATEEAVRRHMAGDGFDRGLWLSMAKEIGLQGLAIPNRYGGAGAGWVEQGMVFEELGRSLACVPYLSTVAVATAALLAGEEGPRERWLPRIADGSLTATFAPPGGVSDGWYFHDVGVVATRSAGGWALRGEKSYVLDGTTADLTLVAARTDAGVEVFAVEDAVVTPVTTSDQTRRVAHLSFNDVTATRIGGAELIAAAHRVGITMLACEQSGGAAFCLDQAVAHASVRQQFGRPIGSFQAVQHHCANMLVAVETARSAARQAARELDTLTASGDVTTLVAGAACGEAYASCASMNVQVHGGIGYTWEHSAHLHVKRSRGSLVLFGSPARHRRALQATGKVLIRS